MLFQVVLGVPLWNFLPVVQPRVLSMLLVKYAALPVVSRSHVESLGSSSEVSTDEDKVLIKVVIVGGRACLVEVDEAQVDHVIASRGSGPWEDAAFAVKVGDCGGRPPVILWTCEYLSKI
jgi:hypothetical protein